jgi:hypothetical protein
MNESQLGDTDVFGQILVLLKQLTPEDRERTLRAAAVFFDVGMSTRPQGSAALSRSDSRATGGAVPIAFSEDLDLSPKDFMLQKQPHSDVERIACLAYYLTHYRNMPHFHTLDLSKLNTEAAQPKFANAAWASANALKRGYLANAPKDTRQISAAGEQFVNALPDRDAARKVMESQRPRRRSRKRSAEEA